jgi:hypothetical protein
MNYFADQSMNNKDGTESILIKIVKNKVENKVSAQIKSSKQCSSSYARKKISERERATSVVIDNYKHRLGGPNFVFQLKIFHAGTRSDLH